MVARILSWYVAITQDIRENANVTTAAGTPVEATPRPRRELKHAASGRLTSILDQHSDNCYDNDSRIRLKPLYVR